MILVDLMVEHAGDSGSKLISTIDRSAANLLKAVQQIVAAVPAVIGTVTSFADFKVVLALVGVVKVIYGLNKALAAVAATVRLIGIVASIVCAIVGRRSSRL